MSNLPRLRALQKKLISLDSLILVGLRTLSKFLLLIFVLLCARTLSQEDFGDFQFVDTLTVQALQLLIVASMVVSRAGCGFPEETLNLHLASLHRRYGPRVALAGLLFAGGGIASDPFMRQAFHISTAWCFAASGLTIGSYFVFSYCMGMMQVQERFKTIGLLFLVMGSIPLGIALVHFGADTTVPEAYAAIAAGTLATAIIAWLGVGRSLPAPQADIPSPPLRLGLGGIYLAAIGMFLVMHNMDIWTTKFFLDRGNAGYYARFEFVGKIIFMISSSLAIVLFPKVGKAHERGHDPLSHLLRGLKGFTLLTVGFAAVVLFMFGTVSTVLFGSDLSAGLPLLTVIVVAKSAQSLLFILLNYEAARVNRNMLTWIGAAMVLEAILIATLGTSPMMVASAAAAASVLGAAALTANVWSNARRSPAKQSTTSGASPQGNDS